LLVLPYISHYFILVHKYKNVTLEVTPEPSTSLIPEQVEIIPNDSDLHNLQISENGQQVVIDAMAQVQVRATVEMYELCMSCNLMQNE